SERPASAARPPSLRVAGSSAGRYFSPRHGPGRHRQASNPLADTACAQHKPMPAGPKSMAFAHYKMLLGAEGNRKTCSSHVPFARDYNPTAYGIRTKSVAVYRRFTTGGPRASGSGYYLLILHDLTY